MPTYVYKNLTTGDTFEIRQPITEPALTEHPETGEPVKRVVQPVGIAFKGSGFYVNDSRGSGSAKAGSSESAAKPSTTASASAD
jgi:putative FmdB family regulatory protein